MVRRKKRWRFKSKPGRSVKWYEGRVPHHVWEALPLGSRMGMQTKLVDGKIYTGYPTPIMFNAVNMNSYGVF